MAQKGQPVEQTWVCGQNDTDRVGGDDAKPLIDAFLRRLADRNDWMVYQTADYLSEEGKTFPYVFLSTSAAQFQLQDMSSYHASAPAGKVRVWIQGAVHGNEPAGDEAVLALLGQLDADAAWAAAVLAKADLLVLPRYNPDGAAYFQRALATNHDPNRDHTKLARPQTRAVKQTFAAFAPHVAADMHEYSAGTRYGGRYVPAADALFSAAKNLNIDPAVRRLSEELFAPRIGANLARAGFRWAPYVTGSSSSVPNTTITYSEAGSDAKIGRNAMGLTQAVVFLCETRGIGIADQAFHRRTAAGLNMLTGIVQTAVDNAERVVRTVQSGIDGFVRSTADIVVTDSTEVSARDWQFVDYASGRLVTVPVRFRSTTPTTANLTRARPAAYIIPRAWQELAERLRISGLEVETIQGEYRGSVEVLTASAVTFDKEYYEGAVLAAVTTTSSQKVIELPPGSFRVSTRQKNAAIAFNALEPENIDSYASFNIVPLDVGDEYPVFREL